MVFLTSGEGWDEEEDDEQSSLYEPLYCCIITEWRGNGFGRIVLCFAGKRSSSGYFYKLGFWGVLYPSMRIVHYLFRDSLRIKYST